MDPYHPTHVLIVGDPLEGTSEHDELLLRAIDAAAPHATELTLRVEAEWIESVSPDALEAIDAAFERVDDGDEAVYRSTAPRNSVAAVESLLGISGGPRVYGIRTIALSNGGDRCFEYVPEHGSVTLAEHASEGIVDAVRDAIEDDPAAVLPREPLVEWEYEGTTYSVSPPSLCVGSTCYHLRRLAGIDADPDALAIDLRWYDAGGGTLGRAVDWVVERIGARRPETLRFESVDDFESAREALDRVVAATGAARDRN